MNSVRIIISAIIIMVVGFLIGDMAAESKNPERQEIQGSSSSTSSLLPDPNEIENRVNAFRSENGLPVLADSPVLSQAAQARAEQMCASNEWSHDNAWTVLDPMYTYSLASENLHYWSAREDQAAHAVDGWASSPGHRENMLKPYVEFGVGVKSCPGFQDNPTAVIITNYFGVPR